ncbi:MAG TPA: MATE family efflux transporter [Clostridia bacterium]|nr:MATE family efflux transporter [Clostridia bacterium]
MKLNSDNNLYKRVLVLAAPIALQNIITMSVGLADNLMVGSLGELALSGVYVANQLQNLLHMLIIGLGTALTVLAIQYWGKKDINSIKALIGIALKLSVGAGLLFLLPALFFPEQILRLFSNEPEVIVESMKYMKIIRYTYIFFAITQVLIASMRCVEVVKVGMYLSIITFFTNVFFNWVFIFGNLGAPALGIEGAALATLIARMVELPLMILYVRFVDDKLHIRFKELIHTNYSLFKDFFKYGFPIILGDIVWGLNLTVQGAIVGRLGSVALASVSIANVFFSLIGVGIYGTAGATSVIIGQTVGAGEYEKVKKYAKKLQILFLIIGVISGATLYFLKDYMLLLYNISEETVIMSKQLITVLAITMVGTAYQMSTLTGIVRAGGSIYFVLINDLIFIWLIVIPSALIAAFVFHAPPVVVFACLKSDQILKCAVAVVKVNRFKWIKNLTRDPTASIP